jgi:hypothetical protein
VQQGAEQKPEKDWDKEEKGTEAAENISVSKETFGDFSVTSFTKICRSFPQAHSECGPHSIY